MSLFRSPALRSQVCIFDQESDRFPPLAPEKLFIAKLRDYHRIVSTLYYDPAVTQKVRQIVPWQRLQRIANEKAAVLSSVPASTTSSSTPAVSANSYAREVLALELMSWFKNDFFSWFDSGTCSNQSCQRFGQSMSAKGSGQAGLEDIVWGASRIELYHCKLCGSEQRFPRYNHPLKLLETRKGRCGEWANTLTCICTVLGFEARLVLDFTDHVWTEIYSESQNRWIHMDSCEKSLDSPLLYETGWGKQLTYCMALSRFEIQDVTWRYVCDYTATLKRRKQCNESWLCNFIVRVNRFFQKDLSPAIKGRLQERAVQEMAQMLYVPGQKKHSVASESHGRQSGSEAWRRARDEMGSLSVNTSEQFIFQVKGHNDFISPAYEMSFNSVTDEYSVNGVVEKIGWAAGTYSATSVSKKVEHDWKMVYLARTEGADPHIVGKVVWAIELQDFQWSRFSVTITGMVVDGGQVKVSLLSVPSGLTVPASPTVSKARVEADLEDGCHLVSHLVINEENIVRREQLPSNSTGILIRAELSGGTGTVAWQKAQLFRQSIIQDRSKSSLIVQVFR